MDEKTSKGKEGKIEDALLKVALGYQIAEVTEEYAEVDGELKLTKRKKTKKDVPPDLKAVQMLLFNEKGEEYASFSDEELEREKQRLLAALNEAQEEGSTAKKEVAAKGATKKVPAKKGATKKAPAKKKAKKRAPAKKKA